MQTYDAEMQYYIKSRILQSLRVKKYAAILTLSVASGYGMYYLGASIWHILIMIGSVEIAFVIADIQPKEDEEKEAYYAEQFIKRKQYFERKKQRRQERLNKEKDIIAKKEGEKMAQVPEDVGCDNENCIAKDECNRFKIAQDNTAREVQTFSGTEVKKCGKFLDRK